MSNKTQLDQNAERLRVTVKTIMDSVELSDPEKDAKIADLMPEIKAHGEARERESRNAGILAGLGEAPEGGKGEVKDFQPNPYRTHWSPRRMGSQITAALMNHPHMLEAQKAVGRGESRPDYQKSFEIGLKDATAAGNLMGEGLYGGTGPTAAGQNPFLPGAFGPGIVPNFLPGIVEQRFYPTCIADLFTSIPTTSPDITYLTEATTNFQAAAVAEGGLYPFSSGTFSRVYEQIGKIANALEFTDEVMRDAPVLYNFLQGRLIEGIQRQEEVQILAGGGVPGVNGLLSRSSGFTIGAGMSGLTASSVVIPASATVGTGAQAVTVPTVTYGRKIAGTGTTGTAPTGRQIAEGLFQSMIDIELGIFFKPNTILMNPQDWHTIRTATDANGQYYGGSFFGSDYGFTANAGNGYTGSLGDTLWNVRVVQTPAMPVGTILTGYFGPEVAQLVRREGISMQMTNTNGSNFVNGLVTLRAEERLGLMCYRPKAFQLVELTPAP